MATETQGEHPGLTRQEARALEEDFLSRVLRNLEETVNLVHPVDGHLLVFDPKRRVRRWDRRREIKDIMMSHDIFDRSLLNTLPLNAGLLLEAGQTGLFSGFTPSVAVIALSLSPLKAFVQNERTREKVSYSTLEKAVKEQLDKDRDFHFMAVLSPTGFSEECRKAVPTGSNFACLLVTKGGGTAWELHGAPAGPWGHTLSLFELETPQERFERCVKTLRDHPDLRMRGGHLKLDRARGEMGFPGEVFDRAVSTLVDESEEFLIRQFDGVKILQRSRF